eukprot:scaffold1884_cov109-Isochrysis_galbana.AAC.10
MKQTGEPVGPDNCGATSCSTVIWSSMVGRRPCISKQPTPTECNGPVRRRQPSPRQSRTTALGQVILAGGNTGRLSAGGGARKHLGWADPDGGHPALARIHLVERPQTLLARPTQPQATVEHRPNRCDERGVLLPVQHQCCPPPPRMVEDAPCEHPHLQAGARLSEHGLVARAE